MRPETAARSLFLILLAITTYLMFKIFQPFLAGIAWAIMMTVVFHPIYQFLVRLFGGRERLAAIFLSLSIGAFVVVPAFFVVVEFGQGLVGAYTWLDEQLAQGRSLQDVLTESSLFSDFVQWLGQYVDMSQLDLRPLLMSTLQNVGAKLAAQTKPLLSNLVQIFITFAVVLVTMTVLFQNADKLMSQVRRMLPLPEDDKTAVFDELRLATRAIFFGVLLTAAIQGLLGGVGFAIAGVPSPTMLGAVMFFAALLPAGTVVVWLPAAAWLFATGRPGSAIFLVIWGVLVVSSADNVLRPIFIGRGLRMHMLLVFFGILGGLFAFGFLGLFLGPLVITLFLFLLQVARRDLLRELRTTTPPPAA